MYESVNQQNVGETLKMDSILSDNAQQHGLRKGHVFAGLFDEIDGMDLNKKIF